MAVFLVEAPHDTSTLVRQLESRLTDCDIPLELCCTVSPQVHYSSPAHTDTSLNGSLLYTPIYLSHLELLKLI